MKPLELLRYNNTETVAGISRKEFLLNLIHKQLKIYFFYVHMKCNLCNQNQLANVSVCESTLFGKREASGNIQQFHKSDWMKVKIENIFC